MRRKHASAARSMAAGAAVFSICSACAWIAASFTSGVRAFAKILKLLRRPLMIAPSHKRNLDRQSSSVASYARAWVSVAVAHVMEAAARLTLPGASSPEKSAAAASRRSVAEFMSEMLLPRCH